MGCAGGMEAETRKEAMLSRNLARRSRRAKVEAIRNCSISGVILFCLYRKIEDASIQQLYASGNDALKRVEVIKVRGLVHNGYSEVLWGGEQQWDTET